MRRSMNALAWTEMPLTPPPVPTHLDCRPLKSILALRNPETMRQKIVVMAASGEVDDALVLLLQVTVMLAPLLLALNRSCLSVHLSTLSREEVGFHLMVAAGHTESR